MILAELCERVKGLGFPKPEPVYDVPGVLLWKVQGRPSLFTKEHDDRLYVRIAESFPWVPVVSLEETVFFLERVLKVAAPTASRTSRCSSSRCNCC